MENTVLCRLPLDLCRSVSAPFLFGFVLSHHSTPTCWTGGSSTELNSRTAGVTWLLIFHTASPQSCCLYWPLKTSNLSTAGLVLLITAGCCDSFVKYDLASPQSFLFWKSTRWLNVVSVPHYLSCSYFSVQIDALFLWKFTRYRESTLIRSGDGQDLKGN